MKKKKKSLARVNLGPIFLTQFFCFCHRTSPMLTVFRHCVGPGVTEPDQSIFTNTVSPLHANLQVANLKRDKPSPASCCTVLLYFSKYCAVRFKIFPLFLLVFSVKSIIKPITMQ